MLCGTKSGRTWKKMSWSLSNDGQDSITYKNALSRKRILNPTTMNSQKLKNPNNKNHRHRRKSLLAGQRVIRFTLCSEKFIPDLSRKIEIDQGKDYQRAWSLVLVLGLPEPQAL
mmetsp:Transcript_44446/g.92979  ORF Transcript_44446/g.92979 Transcript_44446/m.92979 type:complete len:114 (+) Transcript_44446:274-615(+)